MAQARLKLVFSGLGHHAELGKVCLFLLLRQHLTLSVRLTWNYTAPFGFEMAGIFLFQPFECWDVRVKPPSLVVSTSKKEVGVDDMTQWVKTLVTKAEKLNSIPVTHLVEGKNAQEAVPGCPLTH